LRQTLAAPLALRRTQERQKSTIIAKSPSKPSGQASSPSSAHAGREKETDQRVGGWAEGQGEGEAYGADSAVKTRSFCRCHCRCHSHKRTIRCFP
jgi:hypothetical protein